MPIASAGAPFIGERGDGDGHRHGHGGTVTAHGRRLVPFQKPVPIARPPAVDRDSVAETVTELAFATSANVY